MLPTSRPSLTATAVTSPPTVQLLQTNDVLALVSWAQNQVIVNIFPTYTHYLHFSTNLSGLMQLKLLSCTQYLQTFNFPFQLFTFQPSHAPHSQPSRSNCLHNLHIITPMRDLSTACWCNYHHSHKQQETVQNKDTANFISTFLLHLQEGLRLKMSK